MTALAARLDPCLNWFKLLARTKGRVLWIFPGLLLVGYLAAVVFDNPIDGFRDLLRQRTENAPLLREARGLALSYDRVAAEPGASVGKPVVWCVDSGDGQSGYVSNPNQPIIWTVPSGALKSHLGAHGYCLKELAVVEGVERGIVKLRPVETL